MLHDMRLVQRPRVVELMRGATASALTIVQAPFGYGKTVAVEQFAAEGDRRVEWIDARDLADLPLPPPDDPPPGTDPLLLVVEDLQVVADRVALDRFARLVETVPRHVRLLVTTRRTLDLPTPRWRAQGLLAEIGLDDLRFRTDEAAAAFDPDPDPDSAADRAALRGLTERSEGWAAGLRLLASAPLVGPGSGSLDTAESRALLDAVLADQPAEVREFLTTTSMLFRFTGELCRAVTGSPDAGRLLDRVDHADLFLLPLDDEQVWFRYQRLFAELLQVRLRERGDGELRTLHRRAADWFLDHDEPDAIGHLVAAGDGEHALELLTADVDFMSRGSGSSQGVDWSKVFPPGWIAQTPTRMIYVAAVLTRSGWTDPAARWLDDADRALQGTPHDDPAHGLLATARAVWHAVEGDPELTLKVGGEALEMMGAGSTTTPAGRRLLTTVATAHLLLDQLEQAEAHCRTLDDPQSPEVERGLVVPAVRSRIAERQGDLLLAEELAHRSLGTAEALQLPFHPAGREARVALARVLAERGNVEEAEALLLAACDMYEERGWMAGVAVARVELARVAAARMGPEAGLTVIEDVRSDEATPIRPVVRTRLDVLEARLRLEVGELERASELIEGLWPGVDRRLLVVWRAVAGHDTRAAADLLDEVPVVDLRTRILTDLWAARLAAARGQQDMRDRRVLDAASAGVSQGFCHIFVSAAPELVPTLRTLAETRRRLLPLVAALDRLQAIAVAGTASLDQGLSKRELNVLRYLPSDLTNPEIAGELDISTNTLKTHVRSLYRKLGVTSRAAAVRSARSLGLL